MVDPGRWTAPLRRAVAPPARRVVVVPHAGSGPSALRAVWDALPADVEVLGVTLPGRERRARERCDTTPSDPAGVVRAVLGELAALPPRPTALLGHSLGAALAGVLAVTGGGFAGVLLSSPPAPGTPARCAGRFTDAELMELLRRGGAVPEAVLTEAARQPALLAVLRSDLTLAARLGHVDAGRPVRVPMVLLAGAGDAVAPPEGLDFWADRAAGGVRRLVLPGGHFHLLDPANRAAVLAEVQRVLPQAPGGAGQAA